MDGHRQAVQVISPTRFRVTVFLCAVADFCPNFAVSFVVVAI
jgi:hypothetical protein